MKKIRIMLTAIAVLAVVGGALAFKAKQQDYFLFSCETTSNHCLKFDPGHNYTIDETKTVFPKATITNANIDPQARCEDVDCVNNTTGTFEQ